MPLRIISEISLDSSSDWGVAFNKLSRNQNPQAGNLPERSAPEDPKLRAHQVVLQGEDRSRQSGVVWVKRFNAEGIAGLEDKPKAGRPLPHPLINRSTLIALPRIKAESLNYPFKFLWNKREHHRILPNPAPR